VAEGILKVVAIRGSSGTGKTETALALVQELRRRGYAVVAAKDTHQGDFSIDTPGKDSWRLGEASGIAAVVRAPGETSFIFRRRMSLAEIAARVDADYLVAEGFRDVRCANIVCVADASELPRQVDDRTIAISGRAAPLLDGPPDLPVISAPDDAAGLADLVETMALPLPAAADQEDKA
jgi:molybdopterin-guanine dinucleotide biosynthesis protein B